MSRHVLNSSRPSDRSETALSRRVEELDAEPQIDSEWPRDVRCVERFAAARLGHFVSVMSRWTDAVVEIEVGPGATITPAAADAQVNGSRLLAEIEEFDASLVTGPMDRARQHWTPSGRSAWSGEGPSQTGFIGLRADRLAAVKPFGFGLYTSTSSVTGISMWRAFLGPGGSTALPLPRYTWELEIDKDVTVAEIKNATAWVDFVSAHAYIIDDLVFPDWIDIARNFDAVHFTLPMIAAVQGFCFCTESGTIPAAFWDIETTFWLRWRFPNARVVETINAR
jgi:hypothetical protein